MAPFRYLTTTNPIFCGFLFLTACSPEATTARTCERLVLFQDDIAQFEAAPVGDPAERVNTVRKFALELDRIHKSAGNGHLEFAAATTADMYWTIADVAASHAGRVTSSVQKGDSDSCKTGNAHSKAPRWPN